MLEAFDARKHPQLLQLQSKWCQLPGGGSTGRCPRNVLCHDGRRCIHDEGEPALLKRHIPLSRRRGHLRL